MAPKNQEEMTNKLLSILKLLDSGEPQWETSTNEENMDPRTPPKKFFKKMISKTFVRIFYGLPSQKLLYQQSNTMVVVWCSADTLLIQDLVDFGPGWLRHQFATSSLNEFVFGSRTTIQNTPACSLLDGIKEKQNAFWSGLVNM